MDDSRNRLALTLLFLCLFSASVFALESTSVYAGETLSKSIPEAEQLVKGEIPAKIPDYKVTATVVDNTDTCLINCHLILNITSDIILIPSDVKATFKDVYGRAQVRDYEYSYLVEKVRAVDCPEYSTEEVYHEGNDTWENVTTITDYVFCGLDYYEEWEPGLPLVGAGDSVIVKITGHKAQDENIDIIPEIYGIKFDAWAWWNSTYASYREINITDTDFDGSAVYFNITFPETVGGEIRFTTNSTGTEEECGGWWKVKNGTATEDYALNCTLASGLNTIRGYYNNNTAVSDERNITKACIIGDDFDGSALNTALWEVSGTPTVSGSILELSAATKQMITSYAELGLKTKLLTYVRLVHATSKPVILGYAENFVLGSTCDGTGSDAIVYNYNGVFYLETKNGTATNLNTGAISTTEYYLWDMLRNSSGVAFSVYNGTTFKGDITDLAKIPHIPLKACFSSRDSTSAHLYADWVCGLDELGEAGLNATFSAWSDEINGTFGNPPVLLSEELGPATLYKNSTAWGAVSYNHTTNTTYTAVMGLAINGTIIGTFNQTNNAYANGTTWNYTTFDISAYTHGDNVSLWSYANVTNESGDASAIAYTANITMGNYGPDIENLTITDPLFNGTNTTGSADLWDLESDVINCQFNWYVNYSSIYNDTQAPCLNTSLFESGNYTVGEIVHFTINATDSYGDTGGPINSSEVVVAGAFTINNFTWVGIQYETVDTYDYTINFSVSGGDENVTVDLDYHDTNISVGCTNVSETYYCTLSNLEAYPIASNGTIEESTWYIQYDSPSGQINETQDFNVTIYEGIWPTNITSEAEATEKLATTINATYGYAAGIAGTVSGTTYLGSSSGTFSCASGNCTAPLTAPDVDTPTVYQIEANLTLTSSYWAESSTKEVRIEGSLTSTEPADAGSCYSGFWCSNGYDGDWGTFYRMSNLGNYINLTYNLTPPNQITYLEYKDNVGYKNISLDEDCIGTEMLFKIENEGTDDFATYCLNQSDDTFIDLGTEVGVFIDMYETRLWYLSQNNSFTSVVPYGLTDCSGAGIPILHFEVRDEHTNDLINASYAQEFYLETPAGSTAFAFSGTDDEWDICIFPDGLSANLSSFEQYSDLPDYNIRLFSIDDIEVGAAIGLLNYTRYLANDSEDYIFKTIDIFGADLQGVDITIRKFNFVTLAWEISAQATTDITGSSTFSLQPYTVYRITMNKSGYQSEEFDFVPSSIYYVEVTLHAESQLPLPTPDFTDYVWGDVAVEFSPAEGYYNSSQILRYTVLSNTSNLDYYGVSITHTENGTTTEVYSSNITVSPAGGSIQYTTTMNGTYRLYSYFKHNNYSLFDNVPRYYYINTNVTGLAKARDILEAEEPISGWGFYLALLVIAAISAGFVSRFSPEGGVIIAIIVLWMGSLLFSTVEVVNFFGTSITPIVLTGLLTIIGAGAALWRGAV